MPGWTVVEGKPMGLAPLNESARVMALRELLAVPQHWSAETTLDLHGWDSDAIIGPYHFLTHPRHPNILVEWWDDLGSDEVGHRYLQLPEWATRKDALTAAQQVVFP